MPFVGKMGADLFDIGSDRFYGPGQRTLLYFEVLGPVLEFGVLPYVDPVGIVLALSFCGGAIERPQALRIAIFIGG